MTPHPKGGWIDEAGDHYVWVGMEMRKIGKTEFEPRSSHSDEAREFEARELPRMRERMSRRDARQLT